MFENPKRGRQARNFTTNVPKILDLKSSSKQIFFRKLTWGAPDYYIFNKQSLGFKARFKRMGEKICCFTTNVGICVDGAIGFEYD